MFELLEILTMDGKHCNSSRTTPAEEVPSEVPGTMPEVPIELLGMVLVSWAPTCSSSESELDAWFSFTTNSKPTLILIYNRPWPTNFFTTS